MTVITEQEIREYTKEIFSDTGHKIVCKHNPIDGEKAFLLCMIEQCLALLSRDIVADKTIIAYIQSMISLSSHESMEYDTYLNAMFGEQTIYDRAHSGTKLTLNERKIAHELMFSNLNEYMMKSDDTLCCYTAMKAFFIALYCILMSPIKYDKISHIDLIADLDDELNSIKLFESDKESDKIIIQWHSTNKINSMYTLYKTMYSGLESESILDLVSADVIEEDYYFNDERFTIAPSMLMKQYLSIIEREVNIIITLSGFGNADGSTMIWYDMKNRVRKRGINIECLPFKLYKALDDLYLFRNGTMHGEIDITCSDYEILLKYKKAGLFRGLSIKKLELRGKTLHPTVDEIAKLL